MNIAFAIWSIQQQDTKQQAHFWWTSSLAKHDLNLEKEERLHLHYAIKKKMFR